MIDPNTLAHLHSQQMNRDQYLQTQRENVKLIPVPSHSQETLEDYKKKLAERKKQTKKNTDLLRPEPNGFSKLGTHAYLDWN